MTAASRGEVWLVDLGLPKDEDEHEQAGRRPAVERDSVRKIGQLAPERLSEIEVAVLFVLGIWA